MVDCLHVKPGSYHNLLIVVLDIDNNGYIV